MAIYRGGFDTCPTDGATLTASDVDPLIGTTIAGQYVVDLCVGEGAMGRVYLAHNARLTKRKFAIKVLLGDLAADPTMRLRFSQEAEAASRLQHPNVVSVLDFGKTEGGLHYLVMDFIEGGTLCDRIDQGALSELETVRLAKEICLGLTHAHEQGLVHRDFKPDNVALVEHDGKVTPKILDFGLAIISTPEETSVRLTTAGLVVGTPAYISPEQSKGGKVDQRTDLFAFGVSLYEMLSGRLPFDGNVIDMLYKNANMEVPAITERSGIEVSSEIEAIIARLMAKDPADRFPNAREVLTALEAVKTPLAMVTRVSGSLAGGKNRREELESARTLAPVESRGLGTSPTSPMAAVENPLALLSTEPLSSESLVGQGQSAAPAVTVGLRRQGASGLVKAGVLVAVLGAAAMAFLLLGGNDASKSKAVASQDDPELLEPPTAPLAILSDAGPSLLSDAAEQQASDFDAAPVKVAKKPKVRRPRPRHNKDRVPKPDPIEPPKPDIVEPPIEPKVVVKPKVVKPKVPTVFKATPSLVSFDAHGPLSDSVVKRAIKREMPRLAKCYETAARASLAVPAVSVKASFTISVQGRTGSISVGKTRLTGLSGCIKSSLKKIRPRNPPDTGPQRVTFTIKYKPKQ
jgi:serine/threonine protein kinase